MRVLVTGATGFLGSHLARRLADRGDDVRVLARPTSDLSRLSGVAVSVIHGDVTEPTSLVDAAADTDIVFHCAARVAFGATDRRQLEQVNVDGTKNVLTAATDAGAVAVHVSSVAALGPTGPEPVDERFWSARPPAIPYEATKRQAHLVARSMAADGATVRIGTPGGIYGYGDDSSMARLIAVFAKFPTPVGYMPELVQSLVNVDDCAEGLMLIAERGTDGSEYLLCADAVPFRAWFEAIAAGAGRRPPLAYVPTKAVRWSAKPASRVARWVRANPEMLTETIQMATRHQAFSGERARRELGWRPRALRQGMAEMCGALRREPKRKA